MPVASPLLCNQSVKASQNHWDLLILTLPDRLSRFWHQTIVQNMHFSEFIKGIITFPGSL